MELEILLHFIGRKAKCVEDTCIKLTANEQCCQVLDSLGNRLANKEVRKLNKLKMEKSNKGGERMRGE